MAKSPAHSPAAVSPSGHPRVSVPTVSPRSAQPLLRLGLHVVSTSLLSLDLSNVGLLKMPAFVTELSAQWQQLNLSFNHLRTVPDCASLTSLRTLNLCFNQLIALPSSMSQSFAPLRELLLVGNSIQFVAPELAQISFLEKLDLSSNLLSTLPPELFNMKALQGTHIYVDSQKHNTKNNQRNKTKLL